MMGIPDDRFTVGEIGRMTAVKRTGDIVQAMKRLLDRISTRASAWSATASDREPTEQLAHDLGIVDRCLFLGYQDDVAPYYASFDALILPSANEGTPVSAIEALAAGRPGRRHAGRRRPRRDPRRRGRLSRRSGRRGRARRSPRPACRQRRARAADGGKQAVHVLERYSVSRLVGDVDDLYRRLLAEKGLDDGPSGRPRGDEARRSPSLERHLGLPAEHLLRARDVRLSHLRIVDRQRLEDDRAGRTRHLEHGVRQLEQRELIGVAEVDGQVLATVASR